MQNVVPALVALLLASCSYLRFAQGVNADTQQRITSHKEFFAALAFTGVLQEKKYCAACQLNKYQFVVALETTKPDEIALANRSFEPFFVFSPGIRVTSLGKHLTFSVTQHLYRASTTGSLVEKKPATDYLLVGSQRYALLNKDKYTWLPK
ncbi:hypothetical protein [Hymenobacter canadensis]|uniref:Lipoprotein n=1 Tax=Hymenobacter canadensis TaxID=2999067 RepID=A0ABY7LU91_9BACT|nr:hypothetical protein [Hymenobacter canadensis]WBA43969.1 hypothetical protein O3303_20605 [Hymenobacter canadensis]